MRDGAWSGRSSSSITWGRPSSAPARVIDVRPHPHIGLATVTYLFDGEIVHRDSLGSDIPIRPNELNWMSAGRGIVHSERTATDHRVAGERLHGMQCWVALPAADEEGTPGFHHHDDGRAADRRRARARPSASSPARCSASRSPVETLWDTIFAEARLAAGAQPAARCRARRTGHLCGFGRDRRSRRPFRGRPAARVPSRRPHHRHGGDRCPTS